MQALKWYTKAGELGHIIAQYNLGILYKNGMGIEHDDVKSVYWYTKAAEQGHSSAQNNLALCYDSGDGVEIDEARAVEWFTKAAKQGTCDLLVRNVFQYIVMTRSFFRFRRRRIQLSSMLSPRSWCRK